AARPAGRRRPVRPATGVQAAYAWYRVIRSGVPFRLAASVPRALAERSRLNISQRSADAAVLSHAPEVDRDEQGGGEWYGDAVQDVEAQQRVAADEASAE